jgi:hypothetical protein
MAAPSVATLPTMAASSLESTPLNLDARFPSRFLLGLSTRIAPRLTFELSLRPTSARSAGRINSDIAYLQYKRHIHKRIDGDSPSNP